MKQMILRQATCILSLGLLLFLPFKNFAQSTSGDTLDVVNWNLEWFADGDTHDATRQVQKTQQLMNIIDADVYALCEIVNTDSLQNMVARLNGDYGYIVSQFGSFAYDPGSPDYATAQKLALVYRKSVVRNATGRPLLRSSQNAYYNFSSGRFPFLVQAEVKGRDGDWKPVSFIVLHAKAYSDYSSCQRRLWGANEMKDTLDTYFSNARFLIAGDFNDDLNGTICGPGNNSTYINIVKDSTDNNSYHSPTLPLSLSGEYSIEGFSNLIDHVVASNEMYRYYLPGSARSLRTSVQSWVDDYENDVSDHYPILSRYVLDDATTAAEHIAAEAGFRIFPNPAREQLCISWKGASHITYVVQGLDGRTWKSGILARPGSIPLGALAAGMYLLRCGMEDGSTFTEKITIR